MANNITVKDSASVTQTLKTTDNVGVHTPHHNVDVLPALAAGSNNIGDVDVLTLAAGGAPDVGAQNEAAPGTDTAASGLNGRLQRIAQRLTSLIALLPAALGAGGGLKVDGSGTALPVSGTVTADTELPAAAVLADSTANPTTPLIGVNLMLFNGTAWDRARVPSTFKDLSAVAIGSITTVWTPAVGKKVRLLGGVISVSAAVSVLFEDNAAGTTVYRTPKLLADTPYNFDLGVIGKILAAANNVLKATASAAASITGTVYGTEE